MVQVPVAARWLAVPVQGVNISRLLRLSRIHRTLPGDFRDVGFVPDSPTTRQSGARAFAREPGIHIR
jgi:hypothetical protein